MHELLTVLRLTYSEKSKQYHLPSCMATISTVQMQQNELWTYYNYFVDHTPWCRSTAAAVLKLTTAMEMFSLCSNIESTTLWQRIDIVSCLLKAWWHVGCMAERAGLSKRVALCTIHLVRMHLYGHPCLCTWHCNFDQSWTFWTCSRAHLLCPPGEDTDYIRKFSLWKIFFVVHSTTKSCICSYHNSWIYHC